MAYKWRDEIVGKRFLCVTTVSSSKIKVKKINEWIWRQGIIRASNRPHSQHNDLTVLVEYDGVDWRKREWIKVYDQQFTVFLIEYSIVWSTRKETVVGQNNHWLALNFKLLVDKIGLRESQLKPIEYLDDRQLDFVNYNDLKLYEEGDLTKTPYKSVSCLDKYIRQWAEFQNSQKILLTTPSVLVGYRVKVYRSEGTTQWYTAVILSYNENTKELTLTDDTVLEERNEDPTLVQMKLIGDGVVESILKGEEIGITPRRRACNQNSRESLTNSNNTIKDSNYNSCSSNINSNNNSANCNSKKLTNPISSNNNNQPTINSNHHIHHSNRVKNPNNLVNNNNSSNLNVNDNTNNHLTTTTINNNHQTDSNNVNTTGNEKRLLLNQQHQHHHHNQQQDHHQSIQNQLIVLLV
ncbi:probable JmjC domain-containing histone demethylation protein 2C [Panonychus citri]|uniref:probable JmjC domain-containing histone demethylation protein 2C n=1 Tax=Panonychus citri TaxID=50023 RepID=UPI0023078816|nr:probable JmjC domain-containing histone demethylation protein 2C [Panonychus citri]